MPAVFEKSFLKVIGRTSRVLMLTGCLMSAACQRATPSTPAEPQVGRFVIVQSTEQQREYLLDTATGHVWASYELKDHGNRLIWLYSARLDDREQALKFMQSLGVKLDTQPKDLTAGK